MYMQKQRKEYLMKMLVFVLSLLHTFLKQITPAEKSMLFPQIEVIVKILESCVPKGYVIIDVSIETMMELLNRRKKKTANKKRKNRK